MKTFIYTIAILLLITASSCVKEKSFPTEPVIEFKSYVNVISKTVTGADSMFAGHPVIDTAYCTIKFTDGDGDIGNADNTAPPDFIMVYLYKAADGNFYPYDATPATATFDTLKDTYVVPYLTPVGNYKSLQGEIKAKLQNPPIYTFPATLPANPYRVVKFYITLRDRAGHTSNGVYTNEITVP